MRFGIIHLIGATVYSVMLLYTIHWIDTTPFSTIKFWDIIFLDFVLISIAGLWLGTICLVGSLKKG